MIARFEFRISCLLCCLKQNVKLKMYEIIVFPVISFGYTNYSLRVREEQRLRALESRALRRRLNLIGGSRRMETII
jgi:hypothetical protein